MDETLREYHEVANLFPLMQGDEFEELKADIKQNGLIEPIWLDKEGRIIDGRNRHRACIETGITPRFRTWDNGKSLVGFVVSLNLKRRHLEKSQRAMLATDILPMLEKEARERQATSQPGIYGGKPLVAILPQAVDQGKAREFAADIMGVGSRYVQEAKSIRQKSPELAEKVKAGEMTIPEAKKEIKKQEREEYIKEQVKEIEMNLYQPPTGLFDVIVIDPPWPYGTKYDPNGRRAANPYPEMSLEQIKAIELPATENCVLWLWTTHKFLRYSFDILDGWGFRDVAILTWVKDRMGLGSWLRSQSEFCIMAVKGIPTINLTNQTTVIHGPLREHSRKPDEFYEMVDGLCVGYRLDYFSRERREGWSQFGNDMEKY